MVVWFQGFSTWSKDILQDISRVVVWFQGFSTYSVRIVTGYITSGGLISRVFNME